MRRRPFVKPWLNDDEMLAWQRSAPTAPALVQRLAIRLLASGSASSYEVAAWLGVTRTSVWKWLDLYNDGGPEALEPRPVGGHRWSLLSKSEEERLLATLTPRAEQGLITTASTLLPEVSRWVGRPVSTAYAYRLLHSHGWRKVVPRPQHPKADPDAQAEFVAHFPEILREAMAEAPRKMPRRWLFADESAFGRLGEVRRCWAPPGMRPRSPRELVRQRLYAVAAVSPIDGWFCWDIADDLNTAAMNRFLVGVRTAFRGDYCVIFLDGAGWHIAGDLHVPTHIKLVFLPPYSPELNPVEHLWDYFRKHYFANRHFATLGDVERTIKNAFTDLEHRPDVVQRMTYFDWMQGKLLK